MKEIKIKGLIRPSYLRPDVDDKLSRQALRELYNNLLGSQETQKEMEIIIRIPEPRKDWVNEWYAKAMKAADDGDIFIRHCQQATFICEYGAYADDEMASSAPRHGDKYDYKTGIAVAYAKLRHQPIPDYI